MVFWQEQVWDTYLQNQNYTKIKDIQNEQNNRRENLDIYLDKYFYNFPHMCKYVSTSYSRSTTKQDYVPDLQIFLKNLHNKLQQNET